jgi:hypothetical protein
MIIFIHCTSSQPLSVNSQEDDDTVDNSIWIKPTFNSESNDDSIPKLYLVHSEYNEINQPNSSELVRRANFWKRANFWRKRANFWRRDFTP